MALALAAIGLTAGCREPQPVAPAVAHSTQPVAGTPSQAASAVPDADPDDAALAPDMEALPAAAVDSDLESGDQTAIENLLNSEALEAYLPSDLINDGGVILYQTLAARETKQEKDGADKDATPVAIADDTAPAQPPARWVRQNIERSGRQAQLRRLGNGGSDRRAQVVVRYDQRGQFVYQDPTDSKGARRKNFRQKFERVLRFGLKGGEWTLLDFSPVRMENKDGQSGLDVQSLQVFQPGAASAAVSLTTFDRFVTPAEVPTFKPGETLRAEVTMKSRKGSAAFLFAHVVGTNDRAKQRLMDDGTNGDRVAGDGVYTGSFVVPGGAGMRHFGIDVLDPVVFTPKGKYNSNTLGLTFKVKAP
jgi:hypothetical protein